MKPLSDITLRWFDDGTILEAEGRDLIVLFLESLGIRSDAAVDVVEILVAARAQDRSFSSEEIRQLIVKNRGKTKRETHRGLTLRNVQVWLKYFREIKLIERVGDRYHFSGNKKPSEAFRDYTRPVAEQSMDYVGRVLAKIEKQYRI